MCFNTTQKELKINCKEHYFSAAANAERVMQYLTYD